MANRFFEQFRWSLEKNVVDIFAYVTFGSSGAPTLKQTTTQSSKGVVSVTRNSAGVYTFVFGTNSSALDTYYKLLNVRHVFDETTAAAAPASPGMYISGNSIATVGTASVQLTFNSAGTATDPASTEAVMLQFTFGNSSAF